MPYLDHFGLLAPSYERLIRPAFPARLAEWLDLPAGGNLLDVGGGTGRIAQFFSARAGLTVVADISLGMLRFAARKPGVVPLRAASEHLPLADETFDRIVMVDALHHVEDARQTLGELWRALRPGGRLIIEEPDIRAFPVKVIALFEKLVLMRSHFFSGEQIVNMLSDKEGSAARVMIQKHTVWVVFDKNPDSAGNADE